MWMLSVLCMLLVIPVDLTALVVPVVNDSIVSALNITVGVSYFMYINSLSTHILLGQFIMHKGIS